MMNKCWSLYDDMRMVQLVRRLAKHTIKETIIDLLQAEYVCGDALNSLFTTNSEE